MTIRHLNVFITVCKYNNFTRAAEELHIAQPAVSTTIAEIEKYYNVILFERINKKIILTKIGKELLIKAKEVIADFNSFENLAKQAKTNTTLKIGASLTIGKTIIPSLMQRIKESFPDVTVSVYIGQTLDIEHNIADGTLDFALVEGMVSLPNILATPFSKDRLVAVAGNEFIINKDFSLVDLLNYPLLLRERGSASRDFLDNILSFHSLTVHPSVESWSNEALVAVATKNLGVAILPYSIIENHLNSDLKEVKINDISLDRKYFFIQQKDKKLNTMQSKIVDMCVFN